MNNADFVEGLRKARDLLHAGWMQGNYTGVRDGARCYCLMGALAASGIHEGHFHWYSPSGRKAPLSTRSLIAWNDARGRTREEVLACLDNSIAALE